MRTRHMFTFALAEENYVKNLFHKVAILNDLARCGIFEKDVQITLWWLQVLESMQMPAELNPESRHVLDVELTIRV
eukprot:Skav210215  [mRNA]  locus=scaffold2492:41668:41895:+ [translate_table: standard]